MNKARIHIWLILVFLLYCNDICGQDSIILQRPIALKYTENTFLGHIDNLLVQHNVVVAFNSSRVNLEELIKLPKGELSLEKIIRLLFYRHNIKLTASEANKVIVEFLDKPKALKLTIKGHIRDSETGEALVGASLIEKNSNTSTFSNESGFYSLTIPAQSNAVYVHYLGYKSLILNDIKESFINLSLEFDNEIDKVVIVESVSDNFLQGSGSEKIDLGQTIGFQSTSGDNDLVRAARISPKVQSGNEGQVGLYVRGGGSDQNLILFDDVPLYEVSHTAGFSSIFIEESIKDVDFISNGFPARFGGRLSSVMNVRLKEGNQNGYNGSAKFSLPAMKAHLEGPIFSSKTTFNLSGRLSYVDKYLNQLIGDIVNFDNIDLNYNDFVGKITHRFSPTQKVSFSYYSGEDKIGLIRKNTMIDSDNIDNIFKTESNNSVQWGSTVWNGKFTNIVSDKIQLTFNLGGIKYVNNSKAIFSINSVVNNLSSLQELEILSHSQIEDQMASINLDYYFNDRHRFKFGGSWIHHEYNPALYGSDTISTGDLIQIITEDNLIIADELAVYLEDTYRPDEKWQIYGGIHVSGFNTGSQSYRNVQPRFSTVYTPDSINRFTISYSSMFQYVHLLVNPGIGLPSDFWVPSTEELKPESARQISFDYARKFNNAIEISFSAYTKAIENVLEYENNIDLFFDFVNSTNAPTVVTDPNWQNYVKSGSSESRGIEFQVRKTSGTITGWASFTLAKTTRLFEGINDDKPFPYKYDRRHDINIGVEYKVNNACSFSVNWVYGTGNAFSLANERILTPFVDENGDRIEILSNSGDRNNFRFPAFSHLDFQFNYKKLLRTGFLTFNLGLYNAYNRKNAYYIYIYDNPTRVNNVAYKTSLFPILPSMSLGYSF
jgi:hypothetical protein